MGSRKAPWLRRKDWASRRLVSGMPHWVAFGLRWLFYLVMLVFVPVLVLFVAFIGYVIIHVLSGEGLATQLVALGVLVAVGVGAGIWMRANPQARIRRTGTPLRPYRFECQLRTLPGVIGGWFKADVEIEVPFRSDHPIVVALICFLNEGGWWWAGARYSWCASYRVPAKLEPFGDASFRMSVPVVFFLPADILTHGRLKTSFLWVTVEGPGRQYFYRGSFEVPIFDTTEAPAGEQQPEDAPTPEIGVQKIVVSF